MESIVIPTHVIILAQGRQTRMGEMTRPKQLLPLPAHVAADVQNMRILDRTIAQVSRILIGDAENVIDASRAVRSHGVVVVGNHRLRDAEPRGHVPLGPDIDGWVDFGVSAEVYTLAEPGNSSLAGVSRLLTEIDDNEYGDQFQRRIILLGDVVYSWACLEKLFRPEDAGDVTFCGTPDLDRERGELWGVAWYRRTSEKMMHNTLSQALAASSKADDDVYQPGQLRHWLFAVDRHLANPREGGLGEREWFVPIDDYTVDVDLPEHLIDLARSSLQALQDDKEHGLG